MNMTLDQFAAAARAINADVREVKVGQAFDVQHNERHFSAIAWVGTDITLGTDATQDLAIEKCLKEMAAMPSASKLAEILGVVT